MVRGPSPYEQTQSSLTSPPPPPPPSSSLVAHPSSSMSVSNSATLVSDHDHDSPHISSSSGSLIRSTRICVKNLPRTMDERKLRTHFEQIAPVTDCRIQRTRDGRSRRFGFVGFPTEEDAKTAVERFHRTFLGAARIDVEHALRVGDDRAARPWSRYSAESRLAAFREAEERHQRVEQAITVPKEKKDSSHGATPSIPIKPPKKNTPSWADALEIDPEVEKRERMRVLEELSKQKQSKEDGDIDAENGDNESLYEDLPSNPPSSGEGTILNVQDDAGLEKSTGVDEPISDLDWLRSKSKTQQSIESSSDANESDDEENVIPPDSESVPASSSAILNTDESFPNVTVSTPPEFDPCRLFVRNLSFAVTESDLYSYFEPYGRVQSIHVPQDFEKGQGKGFAYVTFLTADECTRALRASDGDIFQGRLLHVLRAKPLPESVIAARNASAARSLGSGGSSYKTEKLARLKSSAENNASWNPLFVSVDTAARSTARDLGVSKSDFYDVDGGASAAVRVALGETKMIIDTKKGFEEIGLDPDALIAATERISKDKTVKRSKSVILAKNLPPSFNEDRLSSLFSPFGTLGKVVFLTAASIGLVEFFEPTQARNAYRNLAFQVYQGRPLLLEWAPADLLQRPSRVLNAKEESTLNSDLSSVSEDRFDLRTVYVKNINFSTDSRRVQQLFEQIGPVRTVSIPNRNGKSLGYGFVEFHSPEDAKRAVEEMNNVVVDEYPLHLSLSQRKSAASDRASSSTPAKTSASSRGSTKIIARNIPFQATKRELRELFSTFGQLKSLRIPKRFDGRHRGFCFVEFVTPQEAEAAWNELYHTHLFGRHLVLEWAKDENEDQRQAWLDATTQQASDQEDTELSTDQSSHRRKKRLASERVEVHQSQDEGEEEQKQAISDSPVVKRKVRKIQKVRRDRSRPTL